MPSSRKKKTTSKSKKTKKRSTTATKKSSEKEEKTTSSAQAKKSSSTRAKSKKAEESNPPAEKGPADQDAEATEEQSVKGSAQKTSTSKKSTSSRKSSSSKKKAKESAKDEAEESAAEEDAASGKKQSARASGGSKKKTTKTKKTTKAKKPEESPEDDADEVDETVEAEEATEESAEEATELSIEASLTEEAEATKAEQKDVDAADEEDAGAADEKAAEATKVEAVEAAEGDAETREEVAEAAQEDVKASESAEASEAYAEASDVHAASDDAESIEQGGGTAEAAIEATSEEEVEIEVDFAFEVDGGADEDAAGGSVDAVGGSVDAVGGSVEAVEGSEEAVEGSEEAVEGSEEAVEGSEEAVASPGPEPQEAVSAEESTEAEALTETTESEASEETAAVGGAVKSAEPKVSEVAGVSEAEGAGEGVETRLETALRGELQDANAPELHDLERVVMEVDARLRGLGTGESEPDRSAAMRSNAAPLKTKQARLTEEEDDSGASLSLEATRKQEKETEMHTEREQVMAQDEAPTTVSASADEQVSSSGQEEVVSSSVVSPPSEGGAGELSHSLTGSGGVDVSRGPLEGPLLLPSRMQRLQGWGMAHGADMYVLRPSTVGQCRALLSQAAEEDIKVTLRGSGQSYGDASIGQERALLDLSRMRRILDWDPVAGVIDVEPGVRIMDLWHYTLEDGWWPPVVSGTMKTSLGGAVAVNIHGKNSFRAGTIGDHVLEIDVVTTDGQLRTCSREQNKELFFSVIGAAGLLGVVTRIRLQMKRVHSGEVLVETVSTRSIQEMIDALEDRLDQDYLVGWVDCLSRGFQLGRGTLHAARYLKPGEDLRPEHTLKVSHQELPEVFLGVVPKSTLWMGLWMFLHRPGMRLVNTAKFLVDRREATRPEKRQSHAGFNFLLDYVPGWQRSYLPGGLMQFQSFVPKASARQVFERQIQLSQQAGIPPFLGVLKKHRPDDFLMSYNVDGYSFALDYPVRRRNRKRLHRLMRDMTAVVTQHGGRFYFAKDGVLTAEEFRRSFPESQLARFQALKKELDPLGILTSDLAERLELFRP